MMNDNKLIKVRLSPGHQQHDLDQAIADRIGLSTQQLRDRPYVVVRKSLDARRKSNIVFEYQIDLNPDFTDVKGIGKLLKRVTKHETTGQSGLRPVVVGGGPSGLFAALVLAMAGFRPLLIERGDDIVSRAGHVERYWQTGQLDENSNVQFGEGGAGAFSDGKLTSHTKGDLARCVLEELVLAGAPADILYWSRPHIGTDRLRAVVAEIRKKILSMGGEIWFRSCLSGLTVKKNALAAVQIDRYAQNRFQSEELACAKMILATGHSARDTVSTLFDAGLHMEPKPFAMGVRIEHLQADLNDMQYGIQTDHAMLPAADYKFAVHLGQGVSVYSFCMCPGGYVIASSSEKQGVVTNGMSYRSRNAANCNSGLLVTADPRRFPYSGPLGGVDWQRQVEEKAFYAGGGQAKAPAQRLYSFLDLRPDDDLFRQHKKICQSADDERLQPSYRPGVTYTDLSTVLPAYMNQALRDVWPALERKIPGFADPMAILTAAETRSSSPVRIVRDSGLQSNVSGLYPCGEGAGYAGGILSAAADGLRCALAIIS